MLQHSKSSTAVSFFPNKFSVFSRYIAYLRDYSVRSFSDPSLEWLGLEQKVYNLFGLEVDLTPIIHLEMNPDST